MLTLSLLKVGDTGKIVGIYDQPCKKGSDCDETGHNANRYAKDLGIRVGKQIQVLQRQGNGPMLVKIGEMRIAIAAKLAERIQVA